MTHAEWVQKAVRLALKNYSARRIAKMLGLHHSTVADALARELAARRLSDEDVEAYRNIQRETIFRLLSKWEPKARESKDAAQVHIRYLERWAKLDGLDAPSRSELTGANGAPIMLDTSGMSLDDIAKLLAATEPVAEGDDPDAAAGGAGEKGGGA